MIIKNRYSIPFTTEIINRIKDTKHFTKLNIYNTFNYIYIIEEDKYKIAFCTRYSYFKYLVILFSFYNTSITF